MKRWAVIDFETCSSCDLKQAGAWRYAEDISTEILCLAWSVMGEEAKVWRPGENFDELLTLAKDPDMVFIAHNAAFEKAVWRNIMVRDFGFPDIPNSRWHDTMAVAAHYALPQELETLIEVLGLSQRKDMEGRKITLGMSKPDKKGNYDRSLEKRVRAAQYCLQDIAGEVAVHKCLGWLPVGERYVWLLNQRINERGLRLDLAFVRAAQCIVDNASGPLLQEFQQLTGGLKLGSPKLLPWLKARGVGIPNLQKETIAEYIGDVETIEDNDLPEDAQATLPLHADAFRALHIRQLIGSASVKKLKRMEACVSADGRARGLSQYHGSAPGRNTGRLLQPYNFPRGTIKIGGKAPKPDLMVDAIMTGDYEHVETTIGPAVEVIVSSLRHSLVPNPGRVFLSGDYAGIQARVVLAVAGQWDKIDLFSDDRTGKQGVDIYLDMASDIYERTCTKDDTVERQTGKNTVLGLGFQMGPPKFQVKYAKDRPLAFSEKVVQTYRKVWAPKVPYLWYGLGDAAVECVWSGEPQESHGVEYRMENGAMSVRLPSGRKIWYQQPKPTREVMPWRNEDGGEVKKRGFRYHVMKMGQWKEVKAFGGLLTENVVMGIEVDIQRRAQMLCEKNGFPVVLEVYDEVVVEPEVGADEKAFKQILLDVEPWVKYLQIPIAVETWMGDRYKK